MNPQDMGKLRESMRANEEGLKVYRDFNTLLTRAFANQRYSDNSADKASPLNQWALTVDSLMTSLTGGTPQLSLTTPNPLLKPFAANFTKVINTELKLLKFGKTVANWVLDAIFGIGTLKIGYMSEEYVEIMPGHPQEAVSLFADPIGMDDIILDMSAKRFEQMKYCGNKYRANLEAVRDNRRFSKKNRENINEMVNREWGTSGQEKPQAIGSHLENKRVLEKQCELVDLFFPEEQILITCAEGENSLRLLRVVEWNGPVRGPYHYLGLSQVPGNLMPKCPGHDLYDAHDTIQGIHRKLFRQVHAMKKFGVGRKGEDTDAETIGKISDGSLAMVEDPDAVKEMILGGPDQMLQAFVAYLTQEYSRQSGNLDSQLGLGPQSETAKQDAMISGQVNARQQAMAGKVMESVTDVMQDLGWYLWREDVRTFYDSRQLEGTSTTHKIEMAPSDREGDFIDYNFSVNPYSLAARSPQQQVQTMMSVLERIFPLLQPGIPINPQKLLEILADRLDMPELLELFNIQQAPEQSEGAEVRQSPVTTRNYERTSSPGASRQGNAQTAMHMAQGNEVQPSMAAAMGRSPN